MDTNFDVSNNCYNTTRLPLLPLKGVIIYPSTVLHFDVGRKKSLQALRYAMETDRRIFLVTQKDATEENPKAHDIYDVGVIGRIKQIYNLSNTEIARVTVEGETRAFLREYIENDNYLECIVEPFDALEIDDDRQLLCTALIRKVKELFEAYTIMIPTQVSKELIFKIASIEEPDMLVDNIAQNIFFDIQSKQRLLEIANPLKRLEMLVQILEKENSILSIEKELSEKVRAQMDKNQTEYYLREQIKAIYDELGEGENIRGEADEYRERILSLSADGEIIDKLLKETNKLAKCPSGSHEATVIRNYLDTCLEIPFGNYSSDKLDIKRAESILNKDHYGLDKVKNRILELLAVRILSGTNGGQIICLVGPPGVGKTSVAKSIARAVGRKYARVSLGGVRDESDIRGHRKTYIGAMPGRIIDSIIKANSMNPLILLDEIDKMGSDIKGDPSSALLEVLDTEQNAAFRDHYLELPLDLSDVLFITTANYYENIPKPLLDRMEIIELSSYNREEKISIAKRHLVKKQIIKNGLNSKQIKFTDVALYKLIDNYTSESGVRELERKIGIVCSKIARKVVMGQDSTYKVDVQMLSELLRPEKFKHSLSDKADLIGTVNGLAWTAVGGEMLPIEVAVFNGSGKLELTGSLGDVMKESAKIAISIARKISDKYSINPNFYKECDIHIHAPEGAVPKDGPSAGITMATAIISALAQIPVRGNIAMTGEITLSGKVLPIGGLKEKAIAAYKNGIDTVLIPKDNLCDLYDVDSVVKNKVNFIPVTNIDDVLKAALCNVAKSILRNDNFSIHQDDLRQEGVPIRQ